MARRRLLLAAVAVTVVVTGCNPPSNSPSSYGTTTEDNFIEACRAGGGEEGACRCVYDTLVDEVPFSDADDSTDDFRSIDNDLREDPEHPPKKLVEITERCSTGPVAPVTSTTAGETTTSGGKTTTSMGATTSDAVATTATTVSTATTGSPTTV